MLYEVITEGGSPRNDAAGRYILRRGPREGKGIDARVEVKPLVLERRNGDRETLGNGPAGRKPPLPVGRHRRAEKVALPVADRLGKGRLPPRRRERKETEEEGARADANQRGTSGKAARQRAEPATNAPGTTPWIEASYIASARTAGT